MHERCTHTTVLVTITATLVNGVMNLTMHSFKTSCRPCTYDQPVLDSSSVILHSMNNDHFIHSSLFNHSQKLLSIILPFLSGVLLNSYPVHTIPFGSNPIFNVWLTHIIFISISIHPISINTIHQHNTPKQVPYTQSHRPYCNAPLRLSQQYSL